MYAVKLLKIFWKHRGFVCTGVVTDIQSQYVRSKLGFFWMLIQPLSQVLIYAFVLSNILTAKLSHSNLPNAYVFFLMSGSLAWSMINDVVNRFLNLFIIKANLIKKISFPKTVLVLIALGVSLINHLILLCATLIIFIILGLPVDLLGLLSMLPLLTILLMCFSIGIGLFCGVLNVFVREVGYAVPILLQLLFWMTPIAYPASIIPKNFQWVIQYNPVASIVELYQEWILSGMWPDLHAWCVNIILAGSLLFLGIFTFKRASLEMADVL